MLEKIKRRLGITDTNQDQLILDLIEDATGYFCLLTGVDEPPKKYDFILIDVVMKLYNRKGSEGMASESVDGYSVSYAQSLFDEYMDILAREFNLNDKYREVGQVRFL